MSNRKLPRCAVREGKHEVIVGDGRSYVSLFHESDSGVSIAVKIQRGKFSRVAVLQQPFRPPVDAVILRVNKVPAQAVIECNCQPAVLSFCQRYSIGTVLVNGQSTSNLMIVDLENGLSRPMEFQGQDALFLIVPKHMEIVNGGSNMAVNGADDRIDILYVPLTKDLARNNVGRANDGVGGDVGADDGVGDDGANGGGYAFDAPSNQDQAGQGSSGCSMINAHHADGNVSLFIIMMTLIGLFASFRLGRRIRPRLKGGLLWDKE